VFLVLVSDGGQLSASHPSHFTPKKVPLVPTGYEARWAPRASPDIVEKRKKFSHCQELNQSLSTMVQSVNSSIIQFLMQRSE
jgi:hypothetical protein